MSDETIPSVRMDDLLAAETTLKRLTDAMAEDCKKNMAGWPRNWMQKHVNDRSAIIKVRQILIELAAAETRKPCVDQGGGFWDCSRNQACVNPQCEDCPQKVQQPSGHLTLPQ